MSQQLATHPLTFGSPARRATALPSDHSLSLLAGTVGALWRARRERAAVARFVALMNALDLADDVPDSARARILEAVKTVAERVDLGRATPKAVGYGRRVLFEDPAGRWSLALIIFRPGQTTVPHDHDGWGCAAVVRGIERERRFAPGPGDRLVQIAERDFTPGEAYAFDPEEIHQPVGIAPDRSTVSLHFLHHGRLDQPQRYHEAAATR